MRTVAIIGGGASGMVAALTAAENKDYRVLLYERQQRVGRKLLATGNGRCNLTNTGAAGRNYHGASPDFASYALTAFPPASDLEFFSSLGLFTVEEYGGRVYPLSNSANSVLDVLRRALDRKGVELHCAEPVKQITRKGTSFLIRSDAGETTADYIIMACGGAAGAKLGGVSDGYELMKALGHKRTKIFPALVPITTEPEYPRSLKGIRAEAALKLLSGKSVLAESLGELQFTENGISGPASFDISRTVAVTGQGLSVEIDFLHNYYVDDIAAHLKTCADDYPSLEAGELFTGILHNRLGRMIVKYSGVNPSVPMGTLRYPEFRSIASAAKRFTLKVRGTGDFSAAQVTAGGLDTRDFNPKTMESRICPGLFACGEVLDIDADCGGYNLHWAWASGRLAGRLGR